MPTPVSPPHARGLPKHPQPLPRGFNSTGPRPPVSRNDKSLDFLASLRGGLLRHCPPWFAAMAVKLAVRKCRAVRRASLTRRSSANARKPRSDGDNWLDEVNRKSSDGGVRSAGLNTGPSNWAPVSPRLSIPAIISSSSLYPHHA
jgi:hypothetical protein